MKSGRGFKIKDKVFLQGYAKTTAGLRLLDGPVLTGKDHEYVLLGNYVISSLENSGKTISHPTQAEWKQRDKDNLLLQVAGMKNSNAMMKAAKSVAIEQYEEKMILIVPYKFGGTSGPNKGYHRLEDKKIICDTMDPEALGLALIEAFESCE